MGQVKAPNVQQPKRGLTDFERKIADILFAKTSTNELHVERVLDVAIAISEGLMKDAVDGTVSFRLMPDSKNFVSLDTNYTDLCFNEGDKVKLLIFKVG